MYKLYLHQCPQGIGKGFRSLDLGTDSYELPEVGAGNPTFFLEESQAFLTILLPSLPLTIISALTSLVFPALAVSEQVN